MKTILKLITLAIAITCIAVAVLAGSILIPRATRSARAAMTAINERTAGAEAALGHGPSDEMVRSLMRANTGGNE